MFDNIKFFEKKKENKNKIKENKIEKLLNKNLIEKIIYF